jgi:hypothetical protein
MILRSLRDDAPPLPTPGCTPPGAGAADVDLEFFEVHIANHACKQMNSYLEDLLASLRDFEQTPKVLTTWNVLVRPLTIMFRPVRFSLTLP